MYQIAVIDGPHIGYVWKTEEVKPYLVLANGSVSCDLEHSVYKIIDCEGKYVAKLQQSAHGKV